ncbi:MAG: TonB family protein [Methylomonas sp.]|jgi:protein TonB|uniref:energy transducer TonB n=1 Tax=Methylomonas sp. TaxID=418 RepID=UPI0025D79FCA|nr:TonB family protein [Methylomonas sp.]MCK9605504.1 TonB family protein [Methylomonas sp.]
MQDQPITSSPLSNDDSLLLAVFVAAVVHVGILLGINFKAPHAPRTNKSIEITLSHAPLKKAPKQAKYLAQDHQLGAGDATQKPEPIKQSLPTLPIQAAAPVRAEPPKQPARETKKPTPQKLVTQAKAPVKVVTPVETVEEPVEEITEEQPKLTAEALQQQIAQLGEQIRNTRQSAEDSKIKFVKSVSTHKYLAAQYVKDWEDKVERTGNLNYPSAAKKPGSSQSLTMDVGINADGSIYSMRIVRSSGNASLDEAAKRIVKMSAPFAALPTDLLKEVNVLVITRVWKFSDETGMTAR